MSGVYQHCGEQHLHRYLAELDFRYTSRIKTGYGDAARAERAVGRQGQLMKRLRTARSPNKRNWPMD
jgi:hypothetical protein